MNESKLIRLYTDFVGSAPESVTELPSSGSNRRYFRLEGKRSIVGVIGTVAAENETFIYLARHFRERNIPVPEVYGVSADRMAYIQEDLGDTMLFNAIE